MSAQDGPPQGMETKQVPGYVPAQTVINDHPGHGDFAGQPGYTNTPGIGNPEATDDKAAEKTSSTSKAAPAKTSGSAANKS